MLHMWGVLVLCWFSPFFYLVHFLATLTDVKIYVWECGPRSEIHGVSSFTTVQDVYLPGSVSISCAALVCTAVQHIFCWFQTAKPRCVANDCVLRN